MIIHFWGARGSIPSPLHSCLIREKISVILENILPKDIANAESKERFLNNLPPWLSGTVGGNTPCISVSIGDGFDDPVIFDCGSGLREMGIKCRSQKPGPKKFHVFFSHFHWDHLHGLPFFDPAYKSSVSIDFYSPKQGLKEILSGQMQFPYFPVLMENMASKKNFHCISGTVPVGPAEITFKKMNHPGDSYAYKLSHKGKNMIYATDTELTTDDFLPTDENNNFFKDADIIILDSQYTLGEAIEKYHWGHSAFSLSVDFAAHWGIKHLVLFHHDPEYDDQKLYGILQSAQWYLQRMKIIKMEISLAVEGHEISL
ncbi:MAG: MBL fold metallo-hydrolase [Treponema sp.]|nr:MBL fold metallo-hydrolase [Treponema sp.]